MSIKLATIWSATSSLGIENSLRVGTIFKGKVRWDDSQFERRWQKDKKKKLCASQPLIRTNLFLNPKSINNLLIHFYRYNFKD